MCCLSSSVHSDDEEDHASLDDKEIDAKLASLRVSISSKHTALAHVVAQKEDTQLMDQLAALSEIEAIRRKRVLERQKAREQAQPPPEPTRLQKIGLDSMADHPERVRSSLHSPHLSSLFISSLPSSLTSIDFENSFANAHAGRQVAERL